MTLLIPTGEVLHCVSYKGDLAGWRTNIQKMTEGAGFVWGKIENVRLVLSSGTSIMLEDCQVGQSDN